MVFLTCAFQKKSTENCPRDVMWDDESLISSELMQVDSHHTRTSGKTSFADLAEKADTFRRCADVRDRRCHGIKYGSCFVASEVIDNLVFTGVAKSRQEAVKLGRELQREIRVFHHVTNDHVFRCVG